eukprot:3244368-Prymnesium_polylepis.1
MISVLGPIVSACSSLLLQKSTRNNCLGVACPLTFHVVAGLSTLSQRVRDCPVRCTSPVALARVTWQCPAPGPFEV